MNRLRSADQQQAALAVRLLLGESSHAGDAVVPHWSVLARWAARNAILVRLADRLAAVAPPPPAVVETVVHLKRRARSMLSLMRKIGDACEREEIPHVFPKALTHYPDMGSDLDLLVLEGRPEADRLILAGAPAQRRRSALRDRIAGTTSYVIDGVVLDIAHGGLGVLGEQRLLPLLLIQRRRFVAPDGTPYYALSLEDDLLLQSFLKVTGRRSLRVADAVAAITLLRGTRLDWRYILATAERCGLLAPLSAYLAYVDQIHREAFGLGALPDHVARSLTLSGWGRVVFRGDGYRFPAIRTAARIYLAWLGHEARAGHWREACRVGLLPLVAAAVGINRVGGIGGPRMTAGRRMA